MLSRLLPERARPILTDEREWLSRLQRLLDRLEAPAADKETLQRSIDQLDRLFMLVVIGEFNAGKSAFINALAGARVLDEGVTPTTTALQMLEYGDSRERRVDAGGAIRVTAPVPLLHDLTIVDTPGTNAIFREHERLTSEFVPQADLVLFITSADRPFTESERTFLQAIRGWGKKVVAVINKIDLLERADDREEVRAFVAEHARALFDTAPEIFPVSARHALRRKLGEAAGEPVPGDRFDDLERYIATTLDQTERLRLKLLNPLGIGRKLVDTGASQVQARIEILGDDLQTIDDVERQIEVYRTDLSREFELRLAEIDNVLQQFENRGMAFFDDTLRVARIPDLLNKARLQRDFERLVVGDVPQRIEGHVHDVIDWMVASELKQWQAVTDHVERRRALHESRMVGSAGRFQYDREQLINTVGRAARDAVERYDREREAAALADGVRTAVAGAALAQVGAVGLGAAVAALASTTAADVTGILAAGTVAVLGLFVIPAKRARAKADLRARIEKMRTELMTNLRAQFQREVERSVRGVLDAVAPYTRFVRAEHDKLGELSKELTEVGSQLARLRSAAAGLQ
jgi:small GTP-binding protein